MPRMVSWNERIYYSMAHDAEMSRVSGYDEHGLEHWKLIETGNGYRVRREEAVRELMESIEAGDPPGAVTVTT